MWLKEVSVTLKKRIGKVKEMYISDGAKTRKVLRGTFHLTEICRGNHLQVELDSIGSYFNYTGNHYISPIGHHEYKYRGRKCKI